MTQAASLEDILDFWHKVEFFIPFDLKQVSDQVDEKDLKWLMLDDLRPGALSAWQVAVPEDHELTGFKLYLGVFDMQLIASFAGELCANDAASLTEEAERTALDGQSCIARIAFDAHGEPEFDPLSVSTVPWAIGMARQNGLAALTSDAFHSARKDLSERLFNFKAARLKLRSDTQPLPLSGEEIISLHELLMEWSGCALPPSSPIALLQILTKEKKNGKPVPASARMDGGKTRPDAQSIAAHDAIEEETDEEVDEAAGGEPTVDILNSFYIEDIERCKASVRGGDIPATVRAYLTPGDAGLRIDLYADAGHDAIVRALYPTRANAGHWPDEPSQKMSLMQQFAINTAFEHLRSEGLFSVNGPPGTGKTTLLREMICENVVRRARELAKLPNASDGLAKTGTTIRLANGDNLMPIRALRPELTGFEMVVASSNNAAVENISTDLPKRKRLGETWRDVQYLQPVAHKVAAQVGETSFTKLAPEDVPWGMISCALGNSRNRQRFVERFFFDKRPEKERGSRGDPCRIWDWRDRYTGPSFPQAKRAFLEADVTLQSAIRERLLYAELHAAWADVLEEQFAQRASDTLTEKNGGLRDASSKHDEFAAAVKDADAVLADLQEEERLLNRAKPGSLARLFGTGRARRYRADVARNAQAQIDARKRVALCRANLAVAAESLRNARLLADLAIAALDEARVTWREQQGRLADCRERFGDLALPGEPSLADTDDIQQNGYWQDAELARLRTRVFVTALALHEAWLAEVSRKGHGFGGNLAAISKLLGGARLENPADAKLIWQSFFMVVPVVSTTFASFARQFRGMGPGSIGWLFIDEAGQAVPKAAVGALWRARRAMVVGDPLQIEPVFTVPTRLINALADLSPHTSDGRCSPTRVSVQRLADEANPFGTYVPVEGADPLWIGSPLRVHRRCVDPMFSIANRIAYQNKMVFGLASRKPLEDEFHLGDSAWVDVRGTTSVKQVVPAQLDVVEKLIVRLYTASGKLPPLYVISPFKAVKNDMAKRLKRIDLRDVSNNTPAKKTWNQWRRDRIGTVHTFQGKEESIVIFVLGADHNGAGSASWAASKPNLLNVAVTRAQLRIYIVGDASLWGGLKYFGEALSQLGTPITGEQWLDRIDRATGHDRPG